MENAHVYLVPGFFGFANLGRVRYFDHVAEHLRHAMRARGVEPHIHQVPTLPTSSIAARAAKLLEAIEESAKDDGRPIHLIGHSTGGLDIRLLLSPGSVLPTEIEPNRYVARVHSAVSVACPHYGTPLAGFFTSVLGQQLLKLLSATTLHSIRMGVVPAPALALLAEALFHSSSLIRLRMGVLERVLNAVLESFNEEGLESTLVGTLRLTRFLHYTTELEFFADFSGFDEPTLDWQNTLSFRLASFASLDYSLDLLSQPTVTNDLQLLQNLLLRLSWNVL